MGPPNGMYSMRMNANTHLIEAPIQIRSDILNILYKSNASHLGSSMSTVEMLYAMYCVSDIDKIKNKSADRDRIIVSKGHAAAATYSVMKEFGLISKSTLETYHQRGSLLQGHVSHFVDFVEHSTGALGHGVSVAVGHAIYLKMIKSKSRVLVLCGDGEIQEGSIWEALMLAVTKNLNNLIILIDNNKISSITKTEDVINTGKLSERFNGFGAFVEEVDGHSIFAIKNAISKSKNLTQPMVLICNTVKGKGVSFAENEAIWHYKSMNSDLFSEAIKGLK